MSGASILYIPHGGGALPLLDEAGHGAMNSFLRGFASTVTRPDAIVVISAHWEESVISITAGKTPQLYFDYFNFPAEAYQYQYPAPGDPQLAERIQGVLQQASIESKLDYDRGYDHGLFIPLMMMYPDADIPCVQVSLSSSLDAGLHVQIGKALSALKSENLLILGSGFSFHNMQAFNNKPVESLDERNQAFEAWLVQTCSDNSIDETEREARLVDWQQAPYARYCHPREEHLLPLQVCYGVAQSVATTVFQDRVSGFLVSAYQW